MISISYCKCESAESRILRLLEYVVEIWPPKKNVFNCALGNLKAAIDELSFLASEYIEIAMMLKAKSESVSEESKKKLLRKAVFVLQNASNEFSKVREKIDKDVQKVTAYMLLEQLLIVRYEFREVNKALMELLQMRWWEW